MQAVLDDLDALIATFEQELVPQDDAALDRPPPGRGWSARQVIAHVALTARLYDERMRAVLAKRKDEGRPGPAPRTSGWFAGMLLKWLPDRTRTFKSPKVFDPTRSDERSDERFDVATLVSVFRGLRATGQEIADRHLAGVKFGTPVSRFLRMSLGDGVRVQVAHARRHLEQIRRALGTEASA